MEMFYETKHIRGLAFKDDYDVECSIQQSSSVDPHLWLGVHRPEAIIQFKDSEALGLGLQKQNPECNEYGWCDYPIPKEVFIGGRMHLNREQAKQLAKKLSYFARTGKLKY